MLHKVFIREFPARLGRDDDFFERNAGIIGRVCKLAADIERIDGIRSREYEIGDGVVALLCDKERVTLRHEDFAGQGRQFADNRCCGLGLRGIHSAAVTYRYAVELIPVYVLDHLVEICSQRYGVRRFRECVVIYGIEDFRALGLRLGYILDVVFGQVAGVFKCHDVE